MSKQHCRSNVRLCPKDEISTQNSFDIVADFGNKVEPCFDIVAGVDRALRVGHNYISGTKVVEKAEKQLSGFKIGYARPGLCGIINIMSPSPMGCCLGVCCVLLSYIYYWMLEKIIKTGN